MPLDQELRDHARTRVNALPSLVAERAAAVRWRLERVHETVCDGYTTEATPGLDAGTPVETKAVRLTQNGGSRTGRVGIHYGTHKRLLEAGGWYAVVLYVEIVVDDGVKILVLAMDRMPAAVIDRYVTEDGGEYQKVRWDLLFDADAIDVDRWIEGGDGDR